MGHLLCPGAEQRQHAIPHVPDVAQCSTRPQCQARASMVSLVLRRAGMVTDVPRVPSAIITKILCKERRGSSQTPLHPTLLQLLPRQWPLGAACRDEDKAWQYPCTPLSSPASPSTQLVLLWQRPVVLECHHHLLLHPSPSQPSSAASPAAEPSSRWALPGWPVVLPVPGLRARGKGHPESSSLASLALGRFPLWAWMLAASPSWAARLQLYWNPSAGAGLRWCRFPVGPDSPAMSAAAGAVLPASGARAAPAAAAGLGERWMALGGRAPSRSSPHTVTSPGSPLSVPVPRVPLALPALRSTGRFVT